MPTKTRRAAREASPDEETANLKGLSLAERTSRSIEKARTEKQSASVKEYVNTTSAADLDLKRGKKKSTRSLANLPQPTKSSASRSAERDRYDPFAVPVSSEDEKEVEHVSRTDRTARGAGSTRRRRGTQRRGGRLQTDQTGTNTSHTGDEASTDSSHKVIGKNYVTAEAELSEGGSDIEYVPAADIESEGEIDVDYTPAHHTESGNVSKGELDEVSEESTANQSTTSFRFVDEDDFKVDSFLYTSCSIDCWRKISETRRKHRRALRILGRLDNEGRISFGTKKYRELFKPVCDDLRAFYDGIDPGNDSNILIQSFEKTLNSFKQDLRLKREADLTDFYGPGIYYMLKVLKRVILAKSEVIENTRAVEGSEEIQRILRPIISLAIQVRESKIKPSTNVPIMGFTVTYIAALRTINDALQSLAEGHGRERARIRWDTYNEELKKRHDDQERSEREQREKERSERQKRTRLSGSGRIESLTAGAQGHDDGGRPNQGNTTGDEYSSREEDLGYESSPQDSPVEELLWEPRWVQDAKRIKLKQAEAARHRKTKLAGWDKRMAEQRMEAQAQELERQRQADMERRRRQELRDSEALSVWTQTMYRTRVSSTPADRRERFVWDDGRMLRLWELLSNLEYLPVEQRYSRCLSDETFKNLRADHIREQALACKESAVGYFEEKNLNVPSWLTSLR